MKEAVVLDSTCLIGLDQINRLEILPALFEPILAPPEVEREFGASPPWLSELIDKGFRLSEDLRREALRLAGE